MSNEYDYLRQEIMKHQSEFNLTIREVYQLADRFIAHFVPSCITSKMVDNFLDELRED